MTRSALRAGRRHRSTCILRGGRGRRRRARAGDLFVIPAGIAHGYTATGPGRPVCLVLDYESTDVSRTRRALHRRLSPATLNELSQLLAKVPPKGRPTLADYSNILAVVARLLGPVRPAAALRRAPLRRAANRLPRRRARRTDQCCQADDQGRFEAGRPLGRKGLQGARRVPAGVMPHPIATPFSALGSPAVRLPHGDG